VNEGEVVAGGLLEARGDGSKALQGVKEHLDAVTDRVTLSVEARLLLTGRIRVNDGPYPQGLQLSANGIRVVAGVGYEGFAPRVVRDDLVSDRGLVLLSWRELDVERAPFRVDEGVDLRGDPTSRTTQCIADDPPFPPAESWWARMTDASMMTPSSSTSN